MFMNKTNNSELNLVKDNIEEIISTEYTESIIPSKMPSTFPPEKRVSGILIQQEIQSKREENEEQSAINTTSKQPTIHFDHSSADNTLQKPPREYIQHEQIALTIFPTSFSSTSSSDSTISSTAISNPTETSISISPSHPTNHNSPNPSSPLSPINNTQPSTQSNITSSWIYGPPTFLHFMNTQFPSIQQQARRHKKTIVYQKKGTTGMAGQITGVCDSLLLAILHNRPFQSKYF